MMYDHEILATLFPPRTAYTELKRYLNNPPATVIEAAVPKRGWLPMDWNKIPHNQYEGVYYTTSVEWVSSESTPGPVGVSAAI